MSAAQSSGTRQTLVQSLRRQQKERENRIAAEGRQDGTAWAEDSDRQLEDYLAFEAMAEELAESDGDVGWLGLLQREQEAVGLAAFLDQAGSLDLDCYGEGFAEAALSGWRELQQEMSKAE